MARAARGAGAVTAPNSILAGGPLAAGFAAVFFAAPVAAGAGFVLALTAGLICSAETAPQISNNERPSASLCMDRCPAPLARAATLSQKMAAVGAPSLASLVPRQSVPKWRQGRRIQEMFRRTG